MNELFKMMGGNMPPIVQEFIRFKSNFHGDPQAQIQQLLNSGRVSQEQYDRAVKMAQQLQQMLPPSAHRR